MTNQTTIWREELESWLWGKKINPDVEKLAMMLEPFIQDTIKEELEKMAEAVRLKEKELENENIAGITNARTRNNRKIGYNEAVAELGEKLAPPGIANALLPLYLRPSGVA